MRRHRNFLGPAGMGGMVGLWGANSLVESVQRGTITVGGSGATNTVTITAVDLSRTALIWGNVSAPNVLANGVTASTARVALTNATTITATQDGSGTSVDQTIPYQVVQFRPGVVRSVQRGTCAINTTATIAAVTPEKAWLNFLGISTNNGAAFNGTDPGTYKTRMVLTNATTVTQTTGTSAGQTVTASFEVVEFY